MSTPELLIRPSQITDARRISYLIQRTTERVTENGYSPQQIEVWKKANTPGAIHRQMEQRSIFCAFIGKQLVGTIALQDDELVGLYVSYSQRGHGIGRLLVKYLEKEALQRGLTSLHLCATPSAKVFYERCGYQAQKPVTVRIQGIAFEETHMEKAL